MLDIYSKKKLWEAEKRKSTIGDAMIQRDVKSIGIHLNNIHVYNLDAIKKTSSGYGACKKHSGKHRSKAFYQRQKLVKIQASDGECSGVDPSENL